MTLRILVTGGTFDKHYDELKGELTFGETHLDEVLRLARLTVPTKVEVVSMLDSLDMQVSDRERVLASCQKCAEASLVVIHGTDTMVDTAAILGPALANTEKRVVLTGAMVPFELKHSDALFNFGFAVAAATLSPPGVYIAMNGRVFPWQQVRKNRQLGVFEATA